MGKEAGIDHGTKTRGSGAEKQKREKQAGGEEERRGLPRVMGSVHAFFFSVPLGASAAAADAPGTQ